MPHNRLGLASELGLASANLGNGEMNDDDIRGVTRITWTKFLRGVGPTDVTESSESVFVFVLSPGFLTLGDSGLGLNTSSTRDPLIERPPIAVDWPGRKLKQINLTHLLENNFTG